MLAPRMLLRAAKVTAPLAAHTAGTSGASRSWRRGAGGVLCWLCVCWGRGQPVPWPAVPLKHLISALARSVGEGSSCSEMGAGAALCPCALPGHDIRRAKLLPGPLERDSFGAAEPREQLCSQCCCFGMAVSQNFVFASVVTSRERNGKGSALLCLLEIQASAPQMPCGSASPRHSGLHTECKLLFKCLCRWILALRCCGQSTGVTADLLC